ncbi:unnamed protein product [Closterium sp. NIES-54]
MDVSTAFLNGILEEDVYMTQPPGYEDGTGRVCKLKKSIYGLKQAPHCWYQKLAAVLEEMGFRTSSCDDSLFLKGEGEKLVLFLVYVDDILLFSSSIKEIQKVQQQLMMNFKCKTLGEVKYYLGMHEERDLDHRWLKLHQEKFIKQLGEKYGIENERKVATPLPAEFKLVKAAEDEGVEAEEQQQFQSLVSSLLYAAVHTRPDISFSVGQLARVVQNPSEEQVDAAERVVKYLNSYLSIGVQYSASAQVKQKGVEVLKEKGELLGEGKLFLTCFTDATWASEKDDSSSVGGYICVVGGGPVSWRSKKQTETALSSVESEYMAMFHRVKEVIWLRRLLEEIGQEQKVAMAGNTSAGAGESSAQDRSGSQDSGVSAPRGARTNQGSLVKEVLKNFTVEKFNGEGYDDWAWKMQLYFRHIGLLKLMIGEEPRPSDPALQEDWDERASAGYYLMSQSLELNQRREQG